MTTAPALAAPWFRRMFILLILFWIVSLIGAVKFIGTDPLATAMPYHQSSALAAVLLLLALLTGALGGAVHVFSPLADPSLRWISRLWTVFIVAASVAALLGVTEGRSGLELPPLLDLILIALLGAFCLLLARSRSLSSGSGLVWLAGMGCAIAGLLVGLMPAGTFLNDRIFRVIAVGLIQNIGLVLAAWALLNARPNAPAENSLHFTGGLLVIWGLGMTLPGLHTLIESPVLTALSWLALPGLPALGWIIVRGASPLIAPDRRSMLTVVVQVALLAASIAGGINALPPANAWLIGTRLTDVQSTLVAAAVMAALLAVALPGKSRASSVFAVGIAVMAGALIVAGIAQVTTERTQGIGYLESQAALNPIHVVWVLGLLLAGIGTLALIRRPKETRS